MISPIPSRLIGARSDGGATQHVQIIHLSRSAHRYCYYFGAKTRQPWLYSRTRWMPVAELNSQGLRGSERVTRRSVCGRVSARPELIKPIPSRPPPPPARSLTHSHYSLDTPPSLYTINTPSLPLRAGIFPFPFLFGSRWRRDSCLSPPSANSCATHPPTPASRCPSIPGCRIIQPLRLYQLLSLLRLVRRLVRPPTLIQAQSAVEYERSTARTQTSPREPA